MTSFLPRRRHFVLAAAIVAFTGALAVVSVHTAGPVAAASTGRLLASNCFQCHGTDGQSGAISQLAGMGTTDFFNKMKDQQTHVSIMGAQARGYSDDEIRAMALYFNSIKKI